MNDSMKDRTPAPIRLVLILALGAIMGACAGSTDAQRLTGVASSPAQPELASGLQAKSGWVFSQQAVAAANPLAAEAGLQMLRAGGSAVDAVPSHRRRTVHAGATRIGRRRPRSRT